MTAATMSLTNIPLSDPDVTTAELEALNDALQSPRLSAGPMVKAFEAAFADYVGRKYAVAVASGGLGMLLALKAYDVGPGQEVIASPYSWREAPHAIAHTGANTIFADIDYWTGTIVPEKVSAAVNAGTTAIVASNVNGHPAPWSELQAIAGQYGLALIEDSTEAIGSTYKGKRVGGFGDCAVFDFSQPGPLICGEGGMVVTDDPDIAAAVRRYCSRHPDDRSSVVISTTAPYQAGMSDLSAALGLAQLKRIDEILERRKRIEHWYFRSVQSFEGIKPPYIGQDVDEVHWFLYLVHLGTRFSRSSCESIVEDLRTEQVEAALYCNPLHTQRYYLDRGYRRGAFFVTEKVADRAIALPFHIHLTEEQIAFIVSTMKDASINVGAGSAIYL
jgi:dTDP-4-amino-4,6-dideoxygalactose transaminase